MLESESAVTRDPDVLAESTITTKLSTDPPLTATPHVFLLSLRVAAVTINNSTFRTMVKSEHVAVLWAVLDQCVVPAEERYKAASYESNNNNNPVSAALMAIDVDLCGERRLSTPILGPLTTRYASLLAGGGGSLRVLTITHNYYDESADLGAFAAQATHFQKLSFPGNCGLTSVRGFERRCDYLRKVNFWCCKQLSSLDGLEHHVNLEEINASHTAITCLEPLRTCPALTRVILAGCKLLTSIEALAGHQWLTEVDASYTPIASVEPLRTCPALMKVNVSGCRQFASIQGLEGHPSLLAVDASHTAIISLEPLRSCPALTKVNVSGCEQLSSIQGLEGHQCLQEVDVSYTSVTSIEPLRTCPALTTADLRYCRELSSVEAFEGHQWLQKVYVSRTRIASVESLRTCPALTTVDVSACRKLLSRDVDLPGNIKVIFDA